MQKKSNTCRRRAFEDAEWSLETSEVRGKKVRAIADKITETVMN